MKAIESGVSRIGKIKVANVPLGQSILLLAGLGISEALVPLLTPFLKIPALSGGALSVIVKLPMVSRIIGPTLSDVLSATSIAVGLDQTLRIRERAQSLVSGLVGRLGVKTAGVRAALAGPAPARVSLGQDFGAVSEQERRILGTFRVPA